MWETYFFFVPCEIGFNHLKAPGSFVYVWSRDKYFFRVIIFYNCIEKKKLTDVKPKENLRNINYKNKLICVKGFNSVYEYFVYGL